MTDAEHKRWRDRQFNDDYRRVRSLLVTEVTEAEQLLGRPLTDLEKWAVYDNYQDEVLVEMGR